MSPFSSMIAPLIPGVKFPKLAPFLNKESACAIIPRKNVMTPDAVSSFFLLI